MKKVLKKGFTLIELMVVIAIIGILATTLAPKLREQLAKAKDSKAVSFLGASRTVASSLIISQMTSTTDTGSDVVSITGKKLNNQMDVNPAGLITTSGGLIIGASRTSGGTLIYGGSVHLVNGTSAGSTIINVAIGDTTTGGTIKEASDLHLRFGTGIDSKSTEGKLWIAY